MDLFSCPKCGEDISDRAPFCFKCGTRFIPESKVIVGYEQQHQCAECGGKLPDVSAKTCPNCGVPLSLPPLVVVTRSEEAWSALPIREMIQLPNVRKLWVGESTDFGILHNTEVILGAISPRLWKDEIFVQAGQVTTIGVSYDRVRENLVAQSEVAWQDVHWGTPNPYTG